MDKLGITGTTKKAGCWPASHPDLSLLVRGLADASDAIASALDLGDLFVEELELAERDSDLLRTQKAPLT